MASTTILEEVALGNGFNRKPRFAGFVGSPMFKLIVGASKKPFYIHKELLGSLSKEFRSHTYNEMKEGQADEMTLHDIDEDTMERFIEWAYTNDYPENILPVPNDDSTTVAPAQTEGSDTKCGDGEATTSAAESLHVQLEDVVTPTAPSARLALHGRLYVLADRFNVATLKDLTFARLTSILVSLDYIKDPRDVSDFVELLGYALDNLPWTRKGEKLLEYLLGYSLWILDTLRKYESFWKLIDSYPDFSRGLLTKSNESRHPPWEPPDIVKPRKVFVERKCKHCHFQGEFWVQCGSCSYYDWEINSAGEFIDTKKIPSSRLSRSGNTLRHQCPFCKWSGAPRLYCPKCLQSNYMNV